jgi:hypothetical protein
MQLEDLAQAGARERPVLVGDERLRACEALEVLIPVGRDDLADREERGERAVKGAGLPIDIRERLDVVQPLLDRLEQCRAPARGDEAGSSPLGMAGAPPQGFQARPGRGRKV